MVPSVQTLLRLAACLLSALCAVEAKPRPWHQATSSHFVVVSDAGAARAREVAVELEKIRTVLVRSLPVTSQERDRDLLVFAVRDERSLNALTGRADAEVSPAGQYRGGLGRDVIVLRLDVANPSQLIYHEYFHSFSDDRLPGLPAWLEEGLAGFWGATEIVGRRVQVGGVPSTAPRALRNGALTPLHELVARRPRTFDHRATQMFYAQSWVLTHYLMLGEGAAGESRPLVAYIEAIERGSPSLAAFEETIGPLEQVLRKLAHYVAGNEFRFLELELGSTDWDVETRPVQEGEQQLLTAEALAVMGDAVGTRRALEPILRETPDVRRPYELIGLAEWRGGSVERAVGPFLRAVELGTTEATPYYVAATWGDDDVFPDDSKREAWLLRAIELDSTHARAAERLSIHLMEDEERWHEAEAWARRALAFEPHGVSRRIHLAYLLDQIDRTEAAAESWKDAARHAIAARSVWMGNEVCWFGALHGRAAEVLEACERAGELAPSNPAVRDSRGVARALTGNRAGAITDLQFFVERMPEQRAARELRRHWVRELRAGRQPLTESVLEGLHRRDDEGLLAEVEDTARTAILPSDDVLLLDRLLGAVNPPDLAGKTRGDDSKSPD